MNTTTSRIAADRHGALVLVLGSSMMSSLAHTGQRWQGIDLTASAHPTEAAPDVTDRAFDVTTSWQRSVRADTSALTSATCDNCSGHSVTLQVVYARWTRDLEVDNAAVAWSSCTHCGGTALSVQVVVVRGTREVTANNRALATNAACGAATPPPLPTSSWWRTPHGDRLSHEAMQELRDWVDAQDRAAARGHRGGPRGSAPVGTGAGALERLVNDDLDSRTDAIDVDRK